MNVNSEEYASYVARVTLLMLSLFSAVFVRVGTGYAAWNDPEFRAIAVPSLVICMITLVAALGLEFSRRLRH